MRPGFGCGGGVRRRARLRASRRAQAARRPPAAARRRAASCRRAACGSPLPTRPDVRRPRRAAGTSRLKSAVRSMSSWQLVQYRATVAWCWPTTSSRDGSQPASKAPAAGQRARQCWPSRSSVDYSQVEHVAERGCAMPISRRKQDDSRASRWSGSDGSRRRSGQRCAPVSATASRPRRDDGRGLCRQELEGAAHLVGPPELRGRVEHRRLPRRADDSAARPSQPHVADARGIRRSARRKSRPAATSRSTSARSCATSSAFARSAIRR